MRTAQIWISAPDPNDGYCVEIVEPLSRRNREPVSIDNKWFQTIQECEDWAKSQGATSITTK